MKKFTKSALAGAVLLATAGTAQAADMKISGFILGYAASSDYSDGAAKQEFYVPSTIKTGDGSNGLSQFDMHARQSRIRFVGTEDDGAGNTIKAFVEMDFYGASGTETVSNSHSPRLRHAFMQYKGFTIGQTWSTFQDVKGLAETLDFIGVADGTVFNRQAMVRYSSNGFDVAIENPITSGGVEGDMPDVVARYSVNKDWGHVSVAGIMRQLEDAAGNTATGSGIALTGKFKVGAKDDIRVMYNTGSGIGRYVGIAAVKDMAAGDAADVTAYSVAFRHVWNEKLRSTLAYSAQESDYTDAQIAAVGGAGTDETSMWSINGIYQWTKKVSVGLEYKHAERTDLAGADGDMDRVIFNAKYVF